MTKYSIIKKRDGKEILIDDNKNEISKPWNYIYCYELLNNKSNYYIAHRKKDCKQAIFSIYDKEEPISDWFNFIYINGLVYGVSDYYIAKREDGKQAIFHKNNKKPITKWFVDIPTKYKSLKNENLKELIK